MPGTQPDTPIGLAAPNKALVKFTLVETADGLPEFSSRSFGLFYAPLFAPKRVKIIPLRLIIYFN
jgi:hypothetical protein